MPITAPNVVRFSIVGFWTNSRPIVSVFDYHIDTTGGTVSRSDAIEAHADDIIENWQSQIMDSFADNYTVDHISYLDLDTVDGPSGVRPPSGTEQTSGPATDAMAPPSMCYLITKSHVGGRGTKPGRFYQPCVGEATIDENGQVTGGTVTALQTRADAFLANTTQAQPTDDFDAYMVVTHFGPRPAPPAEDNRVGVPHRVSGLVVQTLAATQRRRMRA